MSNIISDGVGSVAGWWTNTFGAGAGQQALGQKLDAQLQSMNSMDYAPGGAIYEKIVAENGGDTTAADAAWLQTENQIAGQMADTASQKQQVTDAAKQGAADGLSKAKSAVNSFFESLFGLIPASIWIIAAIGLFLYFGGWQWLTRKARKKLSA